MVNSPLSKLEISIVNKLPLMAKTSTEASSWTYPLQQWWLLHGNEMPRELLFVILATCKFLTSAMGIMYTAINVNTMAKGPVKHCLRKYGEKLTATEMGAMQQ